MKKLLQGLLLALLATGPCACNNDDIGNADDTNATVTTCPVTEITATTAVSGGIVESDAEISARGVCWSTSAEPTVADAKTDDGTGSGTFSSKLTGLVRNSVYYVRAYAVCGSRTIYGKTISFTAESTAPIVATNEVTDISYIRAMGGGKVEDPGATQVKAVGICWSTSENPTLEDNNVEGDPSEKSFTLPIDNLISGTTYYVRAFATNNNGTGYGQQVHFTTLAESLVEIEDEAFRQYCLDRFDLDYDGRLQASEAAEATEIDCSGLGIASLDGIDAFPNLRILRANDNPLSTINLSGNPKLTRLELIRTRFETLEVKEMPELESLLCDGLEENEVGTLRTLAVSGCPALREIYCQENSLETLAVSECPELQILKCNTNRLQALDLSGCPKLEELYFWDNELTALDLTNNKALVKVEMQRNKLTTIEFTDMPNLQHVWCDGLYRENDEERLGSIQRIVVSNCPSLEELFCQENSLTSLTVTGCPGLTKLCVWRNALTTLDLTGCESLKTIQAAANQLSEITLAGLTALDMLDIPDNRLASLDLSDCINLRETWMQGNATLTALNLNNNHALQILRCMATGIRTLDLSNHTYLSSVWCDGCGMESLSAKGCSALTELKCQNNRLTELDVAGCTKLEIFWGDTNNLSEANFSGCGRLTECNLQVNHALTACDLTGCTALKTFQAWDCALKTLDLSTNDNLELVQVNDNKLTSLSVHGSKLHDVHAVRNQLTSFEAADCPALTTIWIHDNLLTTLDISECALKMILLGIYAPDDPAAHTNPLQTLRMKNGQTIAERFVPETTQIIVVD